NSNVFIGAQNNNAAVRLNIKKLVKVIEKGKSSNDIKTRIVGGSTPPKGVRAWQEWEACGYTCFLGERSASDKDANLDFSDKASSMDITTENGRNMNNSLSSLSKEQIEITKERQRRLADGKPYGYGVGRMTKAMEKKLANHYSLAIQQSSKLAQGTAIVT
ncbi:unnamed protein product, partial [Rotaria sordida]